MMVNFFNHPQGSDEWHEARRGVITGSRFRDARDKLKSGHPSKACLDYARDLARERLGGSAPSKPQSAAMRVGTEQEPVARARYEAKTGYMVEEVGFFSTADGLFGGSVDGLIDEDGVLEIKTMVSSDTLFTAVAEHDLSAYRDQCLGYLWLLGRKWVDLVLWCPDLKHMVIHRIERDEEAIEALESDMLAFAKKVDEYEFALSMALAANEHNQLEPA
ncbi:lambda exonuclease family protein [Xenophilus sp. Marseille-Q4582]|uniref:lambda exonuclease family protein n=1 Tax=Xenophilus sp. Marseille-Q4582 TaxID=2866600 RepID=UPI001CE4A85A|nr:lambda exonuclease family protein [Xenophilus sp. Marseille-Q4582]